MKIAALVIFTIGLVWENNLPNTNLPPDHNLQEYTSFLFDGHNSPWPEAGNKIKIKGDTSNPHKKLSSQGYHHPKSRKADRTVTVIVNIHSDSIPSPQEAQDYNSSRSNKANGLVTVSFCQYNLSGAGLVLTSPTHNNAS